MFDINQVIQKYGLSETEVATVLFPQAKYKKQAFDRIKKYEATIDVDQVQRLSDYLHVEIQDLFSTDSWKGKKDENFITLVKGPYKVTLRKDGFYFSLYKEDTLIEQVVDDIGAMRFDTFISHINKSIKFYEDGHPNQN